MKSPEEEAQILIKATQEELRLGTLHYNRAGRLLTTVEEVLRCLVDEGGVTVEPTEARKELFAKLGRAVKTT